MDYILLLIVLLKTLFFIYFCELSIKTTKVWYEYYNNVIFNNWCINLCLLQNWKFILVEYSNQILPIQDKLHLSIFLLFTSAWFPRSMKYVVFLLKVHDSDKTLRPEIISGPTRINAEPSQTLHLKPPYIS